MSTSEEELYAALRKIGAAAPPAIPTSDDEEAEGEPPSETGEQEEAEKGDAGRSPLAPLTAKNVFVHHDAHPLLLDAILLSKYGGEWLAWEPETIWSEVKDDFGQSVSVHNRNKIQAARTCHLVDTPWKAWETFVVVCQAFNNNVPNFRTLQKPTIPQMMVAADMMGKISDEEFSEEVLQFIAAATLDEGVFYLPPPLDGAQVWMSEPKYICSVCGKVDRDEDNDICDSCGAPESKLRKRLERDHIPVKQRYDQCVAAGDDRPELQETPVDVQVAKLLVAREYVLERRGQLADQAGVVNDVRVQTGASSRQRSA